MKFVFKNSVFQFLEIICFNFLCFTDVRLKDKVERSLDIECLDDISVELPVLEEATCSTTPDDHFVFEEGDSENEEEMVVQKRRPPRHTNRVPWTKKEVAEIHEYFGDYLKSKTTPGKREVVKKLERMSRKDCECSRRDPHLIIKKISAMNHK